MAAAKKSSSTSKSTSKSSSTKAVAKRNYDYFKFDKTLSLILAIIPITSYVLGAATRFMEGKILAGVLRILLGWNIIWIIDIYLMATKRKILRLVNM